MPQSVGTDRNGAMRRRDPEGLLDGGQCGVRGTTTAPRGHGKSPVRGSFHVRFVFVQGPTVFSQALSEAFSPPFPVPPVSPPVLPPVLPVSPPPVLPVSPAPGFWLGVDGSGPLLTTSVTLLPRSAVPDGL